MTMCNQRGQATIENALVIAACAIAFIGAAQYFRRAAEGHVKQASDQVGEQWSTADSSYTVTVKSSGERTESLKTDGTNTSKIAKDETQTRNASKWDVGGTVTKGVTQ